MEYRDLFTLYRLPPGRILYALGVLRKLAVQLGLDALVVLIDDGIARAKTAIDLRVRLDAAKATENSSIGQTLRELDKLFDRIVGAFDTILAGQMAAFPDQDSGRAAERIRNATLPNGVYAITHSSYPEEIAYGRRLLDMLEGELAPELALVPLGDLPKRLRETVDKFDEALQTTPKVELSNADVTLARARADNALIVIFSWIIAHYGSDEQAETRAQLLRPILQQNDAMRLYHQRRRPAHDVDPNTGGELEEETEPA
ncbi:MAG: DUF6261 family protein [Myxococcota bacterium]|jgi:hypothetical protein|nr:DUF6261 family protein [Myxococcota bacterium]